MDVEEGRTEVTACHRVRLITLPAWVLFFLQHRKQIKGRIITRSPLFTASLTENGEEWPKEVNLRWLLFAGLLSLH